MHVAILGAGVIGLTTALALIERGHRVTIVDRQTSPGLETSFGNGAQLSYAYVAPLASPGLPAKLPSLVLSRDGPLRIRLSLDPDRLRWSFAFLRACNASLERQTTLAQLSLAQLSRGETERIAADLGLSFGYGEPGKLVVFRSAASFAAAMRQVEAVRAVGIEQEVADSARCLSIEPSLRIPAGDLMGGIFTPSEQVGDCAAFCRGLGQVLGRREAVTWRLGETIRQPIIETGRLKAVRTTRGDIEADLFVLCLANGAAAFARSAGFHLPIQPIKGYSLTLRAAPGARPLGRSVTDFDNKVVFAPLARGGHIGEVRIAGIADLVGQDRRVDVRRLDTLRRLAQATLDVDTGRDDEPWAGLRPSTPDSRPFIGPAPVANLVLNTGHGGLGWTLACGSARLCAEIIDHIAPSIPTAPFAWERRT